MQASLKPTSNSPAPAGRREPSQPTAVSADLLEPLPPFVNRLSLTLVGCIAALLIWSAFAPLQETTKGQGRVIPASKIQVAQNLEGGIVREISVREGQFVKAGDVLLRIDPTQAGASHGEGLARIGGLRALVARLAAEIDGTVPEFPDDLLASHPGTVREQRDLFEARKAELDSGIAALVSQERQRASELRELTARIETLGRARELAEAELAILAPLAASGAASRAEILAAETKLNETQGALEAARLAVPRVEAQRAEARDRISERKAKFRSDAITELSNARVELAALQSSVRGAADKVSRTIVKAPAGGIVKTVHVNTPGQVVQPGSDLVEIVPQDETLLIEARVRPQDIAFLRPGQPALVKLTAYDFALYGGLDGKLERIGADSVTDDKGETYYLIRVRTDRNCIESRGQSLPIIPGMVAEVDVVTGSRTVLAYLTKPLTRMRHTAMTER